MNWGSRNWVLKRNGLYLPDFSKFLDSIGFYHPNFSKFLDVSGFYHPNFSKFLDGSRIYHLNLFASCVLTRFLSYHQWISNFCQECYNREIGMGVAVFTYHFPQVQISIFLREATQNDHIRLLYKFEKIKKNWLCWELWICASFC